MEKLKIIYAPMSDNNMKICVYLDESRINS